MARFKQLSFCAICLIFLLVDVARSDDGLCGIEPPKEGESCSGASSEEKEEEKVMKYDYEEKPMTQEEAEIWEKRFYSKAFYTNKLDWSIRNELDHAEEHAATQLDKAVEMFDELLKKYPNSARALYVGTRLKETQFLENSTATSPDFKEKLNKIFDVYMTVMNRYKEEASEVEFEDYDIMPVMFGSVVHHSIQLAAEYNMTKKQTEIIKRAMEINKEYVSERFQLMLIQNYLMMNDLKEAEKAVDSALENNENNLMFKFLKGVIFKATDRKKEGNKYLRAIDTDTTDTSRYAHDLNLFCNGLYNHGLDHLTRIIHQESSKLHFILSSYQRPALSHASAIETETVWDIDNHVGLSTFDEEFNELKEFLPQLKSEALKAAENVTNQHWIMRSHYKIQQGNFILGHGNWSTLPLFEYGKRRLTNCLEFMPKTCAFFRSSFERAAKLKMGSVKLTVLDAKTKTAPLTGLTNMRLRLLIPIQIPKEFQLKIGKDTVIDKMENLTVFDDSFEHVYDNEKSDKQAAIWLSVDLKHPDITEEELSRMMVTQYAKTFFLTF